MYQDPTPLSDEVALNRCQDLPPVSVVTTVAPVEAQQTLYVATFDQLYAINAGDGMVRWCQQVQPTQERIQEWSARHDIHRDPPPSLLFGTPQVANGVVYVCASGYGNSTYAFNAGDGTLRWRTPTDAWSVSMPFGDFAVPLVQDGIVYTGTYALNEQDGTVLWRIAIETPWLSPQALVDGTLYAVTQMGISAINARNGEVRWLYALDKYSGSLHWKYQFVTPGHSSATLAENVLYLNRDGAYAQSLADGTVLWHQHLGSNPGVYFTPSVVLDGVVYLARIDGHGSILYALNASNGTEYWHSHYPHQVIPLVAAR